MKKVLCAIALVACTATAAAGETTQIYEKVLNPWKVECFKSRDTGRFSYCSVGTFHTAKNKATAREMRSESVYFGFTSNAQDRMGITFLGKGWNTTKGIAYKTRLEFTDGNAYTVNLNGLPPMGMIATVPLDFDFITSLIKADGFKLTINNQNVGMYSLRGSAEAIKHMLGAASAFSADTFTSKEDTF